MTRKVYILAEGALDVAFLGRLLTQSFKCRRVQYLEELGDWQVFAGKFKFPRESSGGLRIDDFSIGVPAFYLLDGEPRTLVLLRLGQGDQIWQTLQDDLEFLRDRGDPLTPDAFGIVVDFDFAGTAERFQTIASGLEKAGLPAPKKPGGFTTDGSPLVGVFVLPDNRSEGTLEDILLALGDRAYPRLMSAARRFVESTDTAELPAISVKSLNKPAGRKKAVISAATAVLMPESHTPRSVHSGLWFEAGVVESTPEIKDCLQFLANLLTQP